MSARETARLAYRRRVAEAAREVTRTCDVNVPVTEFLNAVDLFNFALAAPRPWTSGGQRPQRKRTTRAHRKAIRRSWDRREAALAVRSIETEEATPLEEFLYEIHGVKTVWNRPLTEAELAALRKSGPGLTYPFTEKEAPDA